MYENTVVLTTDKYESLVRASEKISAAERYLKANKYVTIADITAILGIELKGGDGNVD